MIFDSLGIGEVGMVLALAVVMIKPKELGRVMRELGKFKRKALQIQSEVRSQLETLSVESEAVEKQARMKQDKSSYRAWARERVAGLTAADRAAAAEALARRVAEWQGYKLADSVACFASNLGEIDTDPLLRRILADGKNLLLPYVKDDGNGGTGLAFAKVADPDKDLAEGAFGIREPVAEARNGAAPGADLILVPGLAFDLRGGRLGKGKGFYDRFLAGTGALKAGLAFDVQIAEKNLPLDAHDQLMDAVLTDKRTQIFSAARPDAV